MGLFSFARSVGSAFVSAAKSVYDTARNIAVKAIDWLADEAETFVGTVKETWRKVRPVLQRIKPYFAVAATAAKNAGFPWLSAAIVAVDTALTALMKLENSPVLQKLEKAINWAIQRARELRKKMNTEEEAQARRHKKTFEEARARLPEAARHGLDLAALVNDYVLATAGVDNLLEAGELQSFDHYLRLRATQKLLRSAEHKLEKARDIADISADDVFLVKVASDLIAPEPTLSAADTDRLDAIIAARHGKKLLPFVFEELTKAWDVALQADEKQWQADNQRLAREQVLLRRLETARKLGDLAPDEAAMLAELQSTVPALKAQADSLAKRNRERRNYVYASEGFMQMLEKSAEQLASEDRAYLLRQGSEVGTILIDCAQNGKAWEALSEDQQMLIIDFANIFEEECRARSGELEVESRA